MSLSKYCELNAFETPQDIDEEICRLRKFLVGLRIKVSLMENNKVHLIAHAKRTIAQLSFKRSNLFKISVQISK